ncbi:sulfurtransferase complex subunit TusD [Marinibactrum halimedae]|uniref:Sulfurtransferase TusD n=1 Tax=Marinibactrum halimedae TaxID=1444977 RepID=A0AA37T3T4_9GAMM|nr:sulfurtransferase complex subunit TusD [Marinibactrum halimedae]MCD9460118.1 sulfurtransferase complex subunit TusD [Marinibactrum halimedae]GLS26519.1 sulfurtransferase TusD [Marinibactrum halimedae]
MNIALAIYSPPLSETSLRAIRFAKAALNNGHSIHRVFFYHEGVLHGSHLNTALKGEIPATDEWRNLQQSHGIELIVCIASAIKRGVINEQEANRYGKSTHNLADGYELSGLGQLLESAVSAERIVTFGP